MRCAHHEVVDLDDGRRLCPGCATTWTDDTTPHAPFHDLVDLVDGIHDPMVTNKRFPAPTHRRGYPCAKCRRLTFEFYGTGADAWCSDCRFGDKKEAS